jgi:hypothetical protein
MVYVDQLTTYSAKLTKHLPSDTWCHLWSDNVEELHEFARKLGMKRSWFQNKPTFPHYDLVPRRRAIAIKLGAKQISLKEYLKANVQTRRYNPHRILEDGSQLERSEYRTTA